MARFYRSFQWVLWWLLLFMLPVTSLPLVSKMMGSSTVAPLSGPILLGLVIFWFIPYLLGGGRLPFQTMPLLLFVGAALVSCALAFFLQIPPFRDLGILSSESKALLTLIIGVLFFLTISVWAAEEDRLRFAFRVINWSGLLMILWSIIQAYFWKKQGSYPQWMWNIQEIVSVGRLYEARVTGFAQEPSWLAHQLNMLYLPLWLAATICGQTVHRHRLWKISFENFLLLGGLVVLYISLSRVGLLAFLLMVAFLILVANIRLIDRVQKRLIVTENTRTAWMRIRQYAFSFGLGLVLLLIYLGLLFGVGYSLSKVDYRMARLFDLQYLRETSFIKYANQLVIAERVVFWQAGWEVFNNYPVFGVGLGNAGFYFGEKLSAFGWALTEVRTAMYYGATLPNIKSIWVRLLAETGMVGFAIFLGWCYTLWHSARYLRLSSPPLLRVIGWAGSFVLIGFLIEGFSLDTFALPYFWISFGILTAACEWGRRPPGPAEPSLSSEVDDENSGIELTFGGKHA